MADPKNSKKGGRPKKTGQVKVMLTLPIEVDKTLEYLVRTGFARTKSDLIIQLLNEFELAKRDILNDRESWREFVKRRDALKGNIVDELFEDL
ncbi:MAG: hypothetical protein ACTSRZ_18035 [Promethearchaeota archaeon]